MNTNLIKNAILDQKAREIAKSDLEFKKQATELKNQVDTLTTQITELKDKVVSQSTTTPTPAPAKSMTLIHLCLLAGGLLGGYLLFKFIKK
jgi:hypothetical protein